MKQKRKNFTKPSINFSDYWTCMGTLFLGSGFKPYHRIVSFYKKTILMGKYFEGKL